MSARYFMLHNNSTDSGHAAADDDDINTIHQLQQPPLASHHQYQKPPLPTQPHNVTAPG